MSDYQYKSDRGKPKLHLVPTKILPAIARVREYGSRKYPKGGEDNWKLVDNAEERYIDALLRHTLQFVDDRYGNDDESGLPHLWHMCTNIAFLCELLEDKFEPDYSREINDDNK